MAPTSSVVRVVDLPQPSSWDRLEPALFWAWLIPVAFAPVWFGSNLALAWGSHAAIFGLELACYGAFYQIRQRALPLPINRLAIPLAALGTVLFWALIQTTSWVPSALQHPLWQIAASVLAEPMSGAISVDPAAGYKAVLWTATAAAAFILAVQFGREPRRAWLITFVLTLAAGLVAVYGLAVYALGNHWVLWQPKHAYLNVLTATFIGRDDYAALAAVAITSSVSLFLALPQSLAAAGVPRRYDMILRLVLAGGFLLLSASLILTGSRAGAVMVAMGVALVILFEMARAGRERWTMLFVVAAVIAISVALAYFLGDFLIGRFAASYDDLLYRLAIDNRMLDGIAASPWLGYGYGAFEQAFPMFRDTSLAPNSVFEYGHNDWLEALFTLGIPGGLLLWSVFLWIFIRCLKGMLGGHRGSTYSALALALLVATMLHSLVDFSLQIQGFALPFMSLLAVGVAQSWPQQR